MIRKLLNLIYEALGRMMGYKSITDAFELDESVVSDVMSDSMDLWKAMYKDKSPWLNEHLYIQRICYCVNSKYVFIYKKIKKEEIRCQRKRLYKQNVIYS